MKIIWWLMGSFSVIAIICLIYPIIAFIKIRSNKKKLDNVLIQIRGQVDVKHGLLKEYIEINKDVIEEEKYKSIIDNINHYNRNQLLDIDGLKRINTFYIDCMNSFDDSLLINQCNISEEKIGYIKEYYNELVHSYNSYKSNGINCILSKFMSIEDEKLY